MTLTMNKKEIKPETRTKRIAEIISNSKFLRDPKYYKTNKTATAAWDSWAAQGQAGGCGCCGVGHHNCTVYNKRHTTRPNKWWHSNQVSPNLCLGCYDELLKQVNYKFQTY